jgi:hypothetical protein
MAGAWAGTDLGQAMSNENSEFDVDEVEIEELGRARGDTPLPRARRYVIRVDKEKLTFTVPKATGAEILERAGKVPPEQYKLTQKFHGGGAKTIGLTDLADFRAPGVERFMTLKRDQTEG